MDKRRRFVLHLGSDKKVQFSIWEHSPLDQVVGAAEAFCALHGAHFYTLVDDEGEVVLAGAWSDLVIEEEELNQGGSV